MQYIRRIFDRNKRSYPPNNNKPYKFPLAHRERVGVREFRFSDTKAGIAL